jgi:hypothetical protein
MRRFVVAAVLVLISSAAWALPTCWDCVDRLCEHKIAYPFLSCWSGPGYCTAGGGECLTLSPQDEQPWLITDWELTSVEITVSVSGSPEVAKNGSATMSDAGTNPATHTPSPLPME